MKTLTDIAEDSPLLLISAIESRLSMTYEERIDAHENARMLLEALKKAGESLDAELKGAPRDTPSSQD